MESNNAGLREVESRRVVIEAGVGAGAVDQWVEGRRKFGFLRHSRVNGVNDDAWSVSQEWRGGS